MRESSPPMAVFADDNRGQWHILGNGEPMQEKDAEHHDDDGFPIAATSNKASGEPVGSGAPDGAEVLQAN
jgi:hypothetical protein